MRGGNACGSVRGAAHASVLQNASCVISLQKPLLIAGTPAIVFGRQFITAVTASSRCFTKRRRRGTAAHTAELPSAAAQAALRFRADEAPNDVQ